MFKYLLQLCRYVMMPIDMLNDDMSNIFAEPRNNEQNNCTHQKLW